MPLLAIVLDVSAAIGWALPNERSDHAGRALFALAQSEAVVPAVWPVEVTNALLVAERRNRISVADIARAIEIIREVLARIDESRLDTAFRPVLALGRAHGFSSYDATYLELTLRLGVTLASTDTRLRAVARSGGVLIGGD